MTELPQSAVQLRRTLLLPMMTLYGIGTTVGAGNRHTRTPITATAAVAGAVLVFALALPLEDLARLTPLVVLVVFALAPAATRRYPPMRLPYRSGFRSSDLLSALSSWCSRASKSRSGYSEALLGRSFLRLDWLARWPFASAMLRLVGPEWWSRAGSR